MKYKLVERKNPQNKNAKGKFYASPVNEGKVSQKEISADIVALSSLARGDVSNVINSLIDTIPKYLLMGKSVNLGDIGTFRLSFSSKGVEKVEEFNTNMISNVKVIFTPSTEFKAKFARVSFERAQNAEKTPTDDGGIVKPKV
jgi:predicted histone-like DNA-binding protein